VPEEPGDPTDERRLVDVAPGWMLSAGQEIKFVAEVSIVRAGKEIEDEAREGEIHYERCAGKIG